MSALTVLWRGRRSRRWMRNMAPARCASGGEALQSGLRRYPGMTGAFPAGTSAIGISRRACFPGLESLQDAMQRVMPLWIEQILPQLERGRNVLVVSHGNTIRSLVKHIEDISDQDIEKIEIPTASFLLYEMDEQRGLVRRHLAGLQAGREGSLQSSNYARERRSFP